MTGRTLDFPMDVIQVQFETEIRPIANSFVGEAGGAQVGALKVVDVVAAQTVAILIESHQTADWICGREQGMKLKDKLIGN